MISTYYSDLVKDIIQTSERLAIQHKHDHVNPEHVLLAIVDESLKNFNENNVITKVFKRINVDLFSLIDDIEASFEKGLATVIDEKIQFTKEAEQIFTNSSLEARILYSYLIEAEHILLAYIKGGSLFSETMVATKYNMTYDVVRICIRTVS